MAENQTISVKRSGSIITFYSFKGGVGRSMALANVALLLARAGNKVLCVDWDLEAPGLDRYFGKLNISSPRKLGGLLNVLESSTPESLVTWDEFLFCLEEEKTTLHILCSGANDPNYSDRLSKFSWSDYFESHQGGDVIEALRDGWKSEYDFILIDSRTGLTDSSGICTIQMPDILVLLFAANHQNVEGCEAAARGIREGRQRLDYDRNFLPIIPVLSRFDANEESKDAKRWLDIIATRFDAYFQEWTPKGISSRQMLEWVRLPYTARYSFEEILAVEEEKEVTGPQLLRFFYEILARLLEHRFTNVREILVNAGFAKASLEPFLPNETELREIMRADPGYALKQANEIEQYAIEYPAKILAALERLSEASEKLDRLNDAEEILRRAVVLVRSPDTAQPFELARILGSHASLLERMGRVDEAEVRHIEALDGVKKRCGDSSLNLVTASTNYANFLAKCDRLHKAEIYHLEAINIADTKDAKDASLLAPPLTAFAEFLTKINRKKEAVAVLRRIWTLYQNAPNYKDTAVDALLDRLRDLLHNLEQYEDALSLAHEAVSRLRNRLHRDNGALSDAIDRQAFLLELLGRHREAVPLYCESLRLKRLDSKNDQISLAVAYTRLADPLLALGKYDYANRFYRHAMTINEKVLGLDHPNTATVFANLAELLSKTGDHHGATQYMQRALKIRLRDYGPRHRLTGHSHSHLGLLLTDALRFEDAELHHRNALQIDLDIFGSEHSEVAYDKVNLAKVLSMQGRVEEAQPYWDEGLPVLERKWKPGHEQLARVHGHYAKHLARIGQIAAACREIDRAVVEFEKALGQHHPDTIEAMKTQGQLKKQFELSLGR